MKNKQTVIVIAAAVSVVAAGSLSSCGGENQRKDSVLSANLELLDRDEITDYGLDSNDSLFRFEATVADLGRMKVGQDKRVEFRFTNVGTDPIVITKVVTTCGCTSPEWEKKPVMPGGESTIKVGFEAEEQGVFFKKLFVYYAGGKAPLEIAIKGEVARP